MEKVVKLIYESPETSVLELKIRRVICDSGFSAPDDYPDGGDPFSY